MWTITMLSFPALAVSEMTVSPGKGLCPRVYPCSSWHMESFQKQKTASSGNGFQCDPREGTADSRATRRAALQTHRCSAALIFGEKTWWKDRIWFMSITSTLAFKLGLGPRLQCTVSWELQPLQGTECLFLLFPKARSLPSLRGAC